MHSKMNTFDPFVLSMLQKATRLLPARGFKAMVIANPGDNFSVGANYFYAASVGGNCLPLSPHPVGCLAWPKRDATA
jgi:enoyl-CoA hydratase/carnithine racemase